MGEVIKASPTDCSSCLLTVNHSRAAVLCNDALSLTPAKQVMGKNKILVKVHPEGKYVVDLHKDIDINKVATGARVALRNDSYTLHLLLPTKVDPLVSLMKVEKVPDSTYDMIGGLDQQIKEIKEVTWLHFWLALFLFRLFQDASRIDVFHLDMLLS